jgi:hypothetical protein
MNLDRKTLLVLAAAFAIGYVLAQSAPSPEPPAPDRPALRWLARAAKNLLWIALVAEKPPEQPSHVVKARAVGGDGYPILDNAEGW